MSPRCDLCPHCCTAAPPSREFATVDIGGQVLAPLSAQATPVQGPTKGPLSLNDVSFFDLGEPSGYSAGLHCPQGSSNRARPALTSLETVSSPVCEVFFPPVALTTSILMSMQGTAPAIKHQAGRSRAREGPRTGLVLSSCRGGLLSLHQLDNNVGGRRRSWNTF